MDDRAGSDNLGFDQGAGNSGGGGGFLDVEIMDANTHTYVYEPNKSLTKMTIEALPSEESNKQNIMDVQDHRPNLS